MRGTSCPAVASPRSVAATAAASSANATLGHPAQPFLRPPGITLATVSGYSGLLAVPGSGWTITDVFAPNDLPHQYDNPYVDNTAVPLWERYSMNVHDGNWDYPGTRRYALPVGGPLNAPPS